MTMKRERGMKIPEMFDAAVAGDLKAMYIFGEDVAQTDPNTTHVIKALESLEFLVVQEIFENETTRYADVVLPASSFLEKSGHVHERRAAHPARRSRRSTRPATRARTSTSSPRSPGRSATTWASRRRPTSMDEVASLTPDWAGVSHARIGRGGLQWPVAADGTDSPILYEKEFTLPGGRAQLAALPYKPPGSEVSDEFPVILVTGRRLEHYNAGTMTRRTGNVDLVDREWLEIHPDDAERLWISDRSTVSVRSPYGRIELEARDHDEDRARARVHGVPLPGGADEPPDRPVGGRQHVVPGVQGRRRRRAPGRRGAAPHARHRRDRVAARA